MPGTSMSSTPQTFDSQYADNPWSSLDKNSRQWFDPILQKIYRKLNVFGQFTQFTHNNGDVNAKTMTLSGLYDLHPNTDPIGLRQMWLDASHIDSWQVDVTFSHYANKVAYHKYDKIITFWRESGRVNADTLSAISNDKLGQNIADTLDLLSRNSLLNVPYASFKADFSGSNFGDINIGDTMTTDALELVHLGMENRDVPYAQNPTGDIGTIVCITSPGVISDLRRQTDPRAWIWRAAYANPSVLWNQEVGTFQNVRFVRTPKAQLYNCGQVIYQTTVTSPINPGDGAPSVAVDGTRRVGQSAATHYISLDSGTDMTQYKNGDILTIHVLRADGTDPRGVNGGVQYDDGTIQNLRVVNVNSGAHQLSFDKPIMLGFLTDLGGGVYAYVTKGITIHASMFIGAPDVVAVGIGRPMELHFPVVADDLESMYRVSWDLYAGWQNYNPAGAEVVFTAGSFRVTGKLIQ